MLKILILLVLLSTVLAETPPNKKTDEAEEKCQRVHNVTNREMADLYLEYTSDSDKIDRKYKCFVKCVLYELNMKDENGKTDFKQVAQLFYPTDTHSQELIADCAAKHDSEIDDCERKYKTVACAALNLKRGKHHHEEGN